MCKLRTVYPPHCDPRPAHLQAVEVTSHGSEKFLADTTVKMTLTLTDREGTLCCASQKWTQQQLLARNLQRLHRSGRLTGDLVGF